MAAVQASSESRALEKDGWESWRGCVLGAAGPGSRGWAGALAPAEGLRTCTHSFIVKRLLCSPNSLSLGLASAPRECSPFCSRPATQGSCRIAREVDSLPFGLNEPLELLDS